MIAKTGTGKSFKGLTAYLTEEIKKGEILDSVGVRNFSAQVMAFDFHQQAKINSRTIQSVGHDSLSFSPQDKPMSHEDMKRIALDYMEKMGYVETQFAIIRHQDRDHQHCHIIYNRVNDLGKCISDKHNYLRANLVCRELEKIYGLEQVNGERLDKETKRERRREGRKTRIERYTKERNGEEVYSPNKELHIEQDNKQKTKDLEKDTTPKNNLKR